MEISPEIHFCIFPLPGYLSESSTDPKGRSGHLPATQVEWMLWLKQAAEKKNILAPELRVWLHQCEHKFKTSLVKEQKQTFVSS